MAIGSRAIKAGEAFVSMMLDDEEFANSIEEWQESFNRASRAIRPLATALGGLGALMTGPFAVGIRNLLTFARQIDFSAQRVGVMSEEFGRFVAVAKLTGVELEALEIGMKTIGERIIQLEARSGETLVAFQKLFGEEGIQRFLAEGDMMERMIMIADGMTRIGDAGQQSGLALRALGEAGNRLLPFLRLGGDNLRALAEAMEFISPSQEALERSRQLGVAWDTVKLALTTLSVELAATIVPNLIKLMETSIAIITAATEWVRNNQTLAASLFYLGTGITTVSAAMLSWSVVGGTVVNTIKALQIVVVGLNAALLRLIPALVSVQFHLSGIQLQLSALSVTLIQVTALLTAFLGPIAFFTGSVNPLENMKLLVAALNRELFSFAETLDFLPNKWRQFARSMRLAADVALTQDVFPEGGVAPVPLPSPAPLTGTGTSPFITSAVTAAFANQRTIGFSADVEQQQDYAQATAINTEQLVDNTRALIELMRNAGRVD